MQELFARLAIAGGDPRLDQGGALPVLAEALVINVAGVGRERDLRRTRIGAKPEVGAKHIAVGRVLLEQAHELAGEAHEEGGGLNIRPKPGTRCVVEDDDVDVARIVELEGAELPHGDDEIALDGRRSVRLRVHLPRLARLAEEKRRRLLEHRVGGNTHGRERGLRRPDAAEIGKAGQQGDPVLEAPQQRHGLSGVLRFGDSFSQSLPRLCQMRVGIAQEAFCERGRIAERKGREIGRAGEGCREQRANFWRLGQERSGRRQIGSRAQRVRESVERVGTPRRVIDERR